MTEGLCACGCGEKTTIAKYNDRSHGWVRGKPKKWLKGHATRRGVPTDGWTVDAETGCWRWDCTTTATGYAIIRRGDRRYLVHRVLYEDRVGPIPEGLELDHLCRNTSCVNPDHLEPVTRAENARRSPFLKLTHDDAAAIRRSNESNAVLASRYSVTPNHIAGVKAGRSWA